MQSPYTHGSADGHGPRAAPLWVRLPAWVAQEEVCVRACDLPWQLTQRLSVQRPATGGAALDHPLPARRREDHPKTSHRDIRVRLRGDEVTAMDSFGADLTFFPPL